MWKFENTNIFRFLESKSVNSYEKLNKRLFFRLNLILWLLCALMGVLFNISISQPSLLNILAGSFLGVTGFLVSLAVNNIYKRMHLKKRMSAVTVLFIATTTVIAALVWVFLDHYFSLMLGGHFQLPIKFFIQRGWPYFLSNFFNNFTIMLVWNSMYFSLKITTDWFIEKEKAEKALLIADNIRLKMYRYQLNPHFLFNALSSLRTLTRIDAAKAEKMVLEMADFLRYSLDESIQTTVKLKQEIQAIRNYLNIHKVRFDDNLEIEYEIDPATEKLTVPCFILYPLVENAVKYGMQTGSRPLKILIKATFIDGWLVLEVTNSGNWISDNSGSGMGTGIANIKSRLEQIYADLQSFTINKLENSVQIIIRIKHDH